VTCMGAFGRGFRASLEAAGMEAALSVGQLVGMGAGLRCWARKT